MAYPYSGQVLVALAGTVVKFTTSVAGTYRIKPLIANTGSVFIGNVLTTSLTTQTGYELTTGRDYIDITVDNLNVLYLDAANNGDGVCYHRLYGSIVGIRPPA